MAKRFSRKDYEEMLDKNTNEVKMYWESEAGQKRIEKNKKNPFPMTPTLLEMIAVLKNFESKTGQTIPAFFKNVRDKQENECELICNNDANINTRNEFTKFI